MTSSYGKLTFITFLPYFDVTHAGAFANPTISYGWIYPNLLMVLMIVCTYCCVSTSMLCCVMLRYVMLYCVVLCRVMLCYVVSCYVMLCRVMLGDVRL